MSTIARRALMTKVAITGFVAGVFDRMRTDDRGQGAVEYVGIIIGVSILLAAVIAGMNGVGGTILQRLEEVVGNLGT
ncbi:MAG: hypothetical protein FWE61_07560 [Micrococcales bacterium]|nr:hypothetical protein [Micrococcales bacterium]